VNQKTLRIKKVFYDKIKTGEKNTEYRSDKLYYQRLFAKKVTSVILHYQARKYLLVEVLEINRIPKPERFKNSEILTTDYVYEIKIGQRQELFT